MSDSQQRQNQPHLLLTTSMIVLETIFTFVIKRDAVVALPPLPAINMVLLLLKMHVKLLVLNYMVSMLVFMAILLFLVFMVINLYQVLKAVLF
jgi:hypothetical protein